MLGAKAFERIHQHNTKREFIVESETRVDADLTNVLNSIGQITTNIIDTVNQIEEAKRSKDGDKMDAAFDTLREQLDDFNVNCRSARDSLKVYLKPMIRA